MLFMIPLRRTLITEGADEELVYPEGVACAQVLEAGQEGGRSLGQILIAVVVGVLFKCGIGVVAVLRGVVEGAVRAGGPRPASPWRCASSETAGRDTGRSR